MLMRCIFAALVFLALVNAGTAYGMAPTPCPERLSRQVEAMAHDHADHSGHEHGHSGKSACCDVGCVVCLAVMPGQVMPQAFSGISPMAFAVPQVLVGTPLPPILGPPRTCLRIR
jgi:hypothetical protein